MKTETRPEQPDLSDEKENPQDAVAQPKARRMTYKTVLVAVVIGILTVSVLWMFVISQEGSPDYEVPDAEPDVKLDDESVAIALPVTKTDLVVESIDRRLVSLSGRTDRGFEAQQTHSSALKGELSAMAESIQEIKAVVTDLQEGNQALVREINETTSRLESLAKEIRALKVVKRKPSAKHKPRPIQTPPFQLDAIDVWDDATYVAISHAGRVAFLKVGEQQSGWTVTQIDRLKGQVDLQGPAGQVHSVSLPR